MNAPHQALRVISMALLASCGAAPPAAPGAVPGASVDEPSAPAAEATGTEAAASPETSTPETSTPETSTPETSTPETSTPETSTPEAPIVRVGECPTEWLPRGVVRDVTAEETEALAELMRGWLAPDASGRPLIELQRGIVFAKSEDDEGGDGPYPRASAAASLRACGLTAIWLRDHLRSTFALGASSDLGGVTCDENVCCMPGMEFLSNRAIVFRRAEGDSAQWVIESAYEVAEAALLDEVVLRNRGYVARQLARHARGGCPGEPAGLR